ncbi:AT-hook motif nuclear-localized protein 28-like [Henckelia pumila]|uniref:AT-hook motif nuclear-localized protein 28-like n=1 Tax=Henckelia pumila TaxID=405737 RepID=UPI003C6E809F
MKRKLYGEDEDDDPKFNGIFSKLYQQPPPLPLTASGAAVEFFPVSGRDGEQEEDSSSHIRKPAERKIFQVGHLHPPPPHDGATIEVVRRPRGRPPGSRNKPKPPSIVPSKAPSEPSMSPYILELPPGVDVIAATTQFCRKRSLSLCILTGSGAVSNITIKQPPTTPGAAASAVTFHGRFDILSISATILDQSGLGVLGNGQFTVCVAAGPQGQVVGGVVVGPMVSAVTIYLVAGTFSGHSFCRLQPDVDGDDTSRNGGGDEYRPNVSGEAAAHCPIGSLYSYG